MQTVLPTLFCEPTRLWSPWPRPVVCLWEGDRKQVVRQFVATCQMNRSYQESEYIRHTVTPMEECTLRHRVAPNPPRADAHPS